MTLTPLFRTRFKDMHARKILETSNPSEYLEMVFGNTEGLTDAFSQVAEGVPERRFEDIVNREDNVGQWADFIRHEQKKQGSKWSRSEPLKKLPECLERWRNALEVDSPPPQDIIVGHVNMALGDGNLGLLDQEERIQLGLRAFRFMLWRLWR